MPMAGLASIQTLRGIAVMGVLVAHLMSIEAKAGGDTLLSPVFNLGMAGVDLFFVISGFIMVHTSWAKPRGIGSVGSFLFARATRIYPLYWLVTLALVPIWLYRPGLVFGSIPGEPNLLRNFLLLPDDRLPLLAVGWTLIHEVFFYLVFVLSLLIPRRWLVAFLGAWAVAVIAGSALGLGAVSPTTAILFSPLSLEFVAGALAAVAFNATGRDNGWAALAVGLAWLLCAMAMAGPDPMAVFDDHLIRTALFGAPCALLAYGAARIEAGGQTFPAWLAAIGDSSYALYLTHVLTLTALSMLWRPFALPGLWDNLIALPALTAGAIALGFATWAWLERPALRTLRAFRPRHATA